MAQGQHVVHLGAPGLLCSVWHLFSVDLADNALQELGNDLSGIALEEPVSRVHATSWGIALVHVDDSDSGTPSTRDVYVASGRINFRARANDHDQVNIVLTDPGVYVLQHVAW
jgi:hypothetical protein